MRFVWLVLLFSIPMGPLATAAAQSSDAPAGYDHVIDQAVAEFAASHWAEARALFLQGHEMFPNARTLRGIGMSSYELRDYPEAVRTLDQALASTVRPLTDEQRTQVTELRERAAALVGRYEVPAAPAGARLYLDGEHLTMDDGWPGSPGHVLLGVGEHQIAIRLDDGRATAAHVVVRGHVDGALDIDLAPLAPPAEPAHTVGDPPPSYDAIPPAPQGDATPWIVMGVGFGVAAIGGILLALGYVDIATVQNATGGTPWSTLSGAYDRAPIMTGVGATALGLGLGTALLGLIWGIAASGPTSARDERLVVDLGIGTLSLRGTF
jgi:hypothetical protein